MRGAVSLLLRAGLAFTFLYAGVAALAEPQNWSGFLPSFFQSRGNLEVLLTAFSAFEIALALWLVSGIAARAAAGVSFLLLSALVVLNLGALDILFRDVGLAAAALALFFYADLTH